MKDLRQHPAHPTQSPAQRNATRTTAQDRLDHDVIRAGILRRHSEPSAPDHSVAISASVPLPLPEGSSRRGRAPQDRQALEDHIRRTIDGWTAEEQATAYWYLYACGMTLERAKAIRHKSTPKT